MENKKINFKTKFIFKDVQKMCGIQNCLRDMTCLLYILVTQCLCFLSSFLICYEGAIFVGVIRLFVCLNFLVNWWNYGM